MSKIINISRDELIDLYINKKMTTIEVGKHLSLGRTTINRYLLKFNIPIRNGRQAPRSRQWTGKCDLCNKSAERVYRCKSCADKEYRKKNLKELNLKSKAYRIKHKDKVNLCIQKWVENNRDKSREYKRINKAKRRQLYKDGDLVIKQWREILAKQNGICAYCNKKATMTLEHITPLSRGGRHTASNVCGVCMKCNISKNNKLVSEWSMLKNG